MACSTETERYPAAPLSNTAHFKEVHLGPENPLNPYDSLGWLHFELQHKIYDLDQQQKPYAVLAPFLDSLARTYPLFVSHQSLQYQVLSSTEIQSYLQDPEASLTDVIDQTSLSQKAKNYLHLITTDLIIYQKDGATYKTLYDYVVDFEDTVLADSLLGTYETALLLQFSTLARYGLYTTKPRPKKNTDPEWDLLVSHFTGAVQGASFDPASGLINALLLGIFENE